MIKLWLLTTEFPPFVGGGIGTYCDEFASQAAGAGLELTVFVGDRNFANSSPEVSCREATTVVRFNPLKVPHKPGLLADAEMPWAFYAMVMERINGGDRPDIIEAQDYLAIAYFLLDDKERRSSILDRIPVAVTLHGPAYAGWVIKRENAFDLPRFWLAEMERFCIRRADVVYAPSQFVARRVAQPKQIAAAEIVRNPFAVPPAEACGQGEETGVFYFGRLEHKKGIFFLLEAWTRLGPAWPDVPLTIIGGYSESIMEEIRQRFPALLSRSSVRFTGLLKREDAQRRLRTAQVVVIPSLFDAYAYAAVEALALKRLVVLSSDVGASEILENGVSAFIYENSDPDGLENALRRALALCPAQRAEMGERARQAVIECSGPVAVGRKAVVAREAIARAGTGRRPRLRLLDQLYCRSIRNRLLRRCIGGLIIARIGVIGKPRWLTLS